MPESKKIPKKELPCYLQGRKLTFFVAEDVESLITDVNDPDKVPCWADIWPAAYGLANFIWKSVTFNPAKKVLELGAGMGLPGIVCALKGAPVTLSDFNPLALEMAGENARHNGLEVELLREDWRTFSCREQFDCLIASDILYDPRLNPFLGRIFYENLRPGGKILVSHSCRTITYDFLKEWHDKSLFGREDYMEEVELSGTLLPRYEIAIHVFKALR